MSCCFQRQLRHFTNFREKRVLSVFVDARVRGEEEMTTTLPLTAGREEEGKKRAGEGEGDDDDDDDCLKFREEVDDDDDDATDSELDEKEENDDCNGTVTKEEEGKERVVDAKTLVRRRKQKVEELMTLYEEAYYDLIEKMRRKHRKFQLERGHVGLKSAALRLQKQRTKNGAATATTTKASSKGNNNDEGEGKANSAGEGDGGIKEEAGDCWESGTTCSEEQCEKNVVPFARFCFEHIDRDPRQKLYALNGRTGRVEWITEKLSTPTVTNVNVNENNKISVGGENGARKVDGSAALNAEIASLNTVGATNGNTSPGGADVSLAASLGLI